MSRISHGEPSKGIDDQLFDTHLFNVRINWYGLIIEYLKKGYIDSNVPKEERSQIVIKAKPYTLYDGQLYKSGPNGVLRHGLFSREVFKELEGFHERLVGGHFGMNTTIRKILSSRYWWPVNHKDVVELCQNYDICQCL
jgi:hypothetical protein